MTEMNERILRILNKSALGAGPLRPTTLFNENWMLWLLLDWSSQNSSGKHPLRFAEGSTWYSEALLLSQFGPRFRKDPLGEGRTHADGVIGHFRVGDVGKGDFVLNAQADQFVVLEGKMKSSLSPGTNRIPGYDQAARNVACMAESMRKAKRPPKLVSSLAFFVIAPQEQIAMGVFGDLVTKQSIAVKVKRRVDAYGGEKDVWFSEWFEPTLEAMEIRLLSWEEIIEGVGLPIRDFYQNCLQYNGPKGSQ